MHPRLYVASVDDPGCYERMVRPHGLRLTLVGSGDFRLNYCRVSFQHVQLQTAQEILPRILEGAISGRDNGILLHLKPGPPSFIAGESIGDDKVGLFSGLQASLCHRLTGPSHWASVLMERDDWATIGSLLNGQSPCFRPSAPVSAPNGPPLEKMRGLIRSIERLARDAPELLRDQDFARGLDDALLRAALACTGAGCPDTATGDWRHHARIIRRFTNLIEESAEQALYLAEVCLALKISGRTLRQCCHEYFGMGPKHYLLLRRLHLARSVLLASSAGSDTVTGIATRFGFWELGRFSVAYRRLFGETPVATLRRPPTRADAGLLVHRPVLHSVLVPTMADPPSSPQVGG